MRGTRKALTEKIILKLLPEEHDEREEPCIYLGEEHFR